MKNKNLQNKQGLAALLFFSLFITDITGAIVMTMLGLFLCYRIAVGWAATTKVDIGLLVVAIISYVAGTIFGYVKHSTIWFVLAPYVIFVVLITILLVVYAAIGVTARIFHFNYAFSNRENAGEPISVYVPLLILVLTILNGLSIGIHDYAPIVIYPLLMLLAICLGVSKKNSSLMHSLF